LPAIGQGIIGTQTRENDIAIKKWLNSQLSNYLSKERRSIYHNPDYSAADCIKIKTILQSAA